MGRKLTSVLVICLLAGSTLVAQDSATNKLQQLQEQLNQQQQQLKAQQEAISQLQRQIEDAQAQAASPRVVNAAQTVKDKPKGTEVEAPLAIRYKGLSFVPGGFLEANFITRVRNQNADVASIANAAPFGGTTAARMSEFRASGRSTRFSLLGTGNAGQTKLTGYFEVDFYGGGRANQTTTNSYTPRMRQLFGQADFSDGVTVTAGQTWSLLTTHRKGIATRAELVPNVMDAMYVIGWQYARQVGFRVTKNFNNKVWAAVAIEAPDNGTVISTGVPSAFLNSIAGLSSSMSIYPENTASNSYFPDVLAKVAFEPGWGHYEVSGVARFFRDRVGIGTADARNLKSEGGGVKVAAILPVVKKKADVILQTMAGNGIGRYGDLVAPDVVIKYNPGAPTDRSNGTLVGVRTYNFMAGLETHPRPKLDLYLYSGTAYYGRTTWRNAENNFALVGLGSPAVNNSGCYNEVGGTCQAQNKSSQQISVAGYYKLFSGNFGTFLYGAQYNYIHRTVWSSGNGLYPTSPKGWDSVAMTGFRYFLP